MYIQKTVTGYEKDGCQVSRRALFLILIRPHVESREGNEVRAIVRKVALRSCGQFMMGCAFAKGKRITISGAYGSDGLPVSVPPSIFEQGIPLPSDLKDTWNNGGGWNGAGSEADAMRKWAIDNLHRLYPPEAKARARKIRRESVKVPTSRMSFKRAMETVRSFSTSLRMIHLEARKTGRTADQIREDIARATYQQPIWNRLPGWAKSELTGYGRALSDEDYSSHLVWKVLFRGEYLEGAQVPSGGWSEVDGKAGCHFWKDNGKPFGSIPVAESVAK